MTTNHHDTNGTRHEAELLDLAKRFWLEACAPDEADIERLHEALVYRDIAALRKLLAEHNIA